MTETDSNYNRLRWKCRRGMLELDLVLLHFLENHFQNLSSQQQQCFEKLLDEQDPQLFRWFLKREIPEDKEVAAMVELINQDHACS